MAYLAARRFCCARVTAWALADTLCVSLCRTHQLDSLEDTSLGDEEERSGEHRLDKLREKTGVKTVDTFGLEDVQDGLERGLVLVRGGLQARLDHDLSSACAYGYILARAAHVRVSDTRRDELGRSAKDEHVPVGEGSPPGDLARCGRGALARQSIRQQERDESLECGVLPSADAADA